MIVRTAVFSLFVLAAGPCLAEGQVDPRFSFAVEADVGVGYFASFGGGGASQLIYEGGAAFAAPVAENRQVVVSLRGGGSHATGASLTFGTLGIGYRMLKEFDALETRLDLGIGGDLSRIVTNRQPRPTDDFSLAALFGFGALYQFARGWRAGLELSGGFYAIHLRAQFQAMPVLTFSW